MRKLQGYLTGVNADFTKQEKGLKTRIDDNFKKVKVSDILLSILIDKKLNSTEKAILGIIFDNTFSTKQNYEDYGDVKYFVSDLSINNDTSIEIDSKINTRLLCYQLDTSKKTIFTNIHNLMDKGIITFTREDFSGYGKIKLNIGFLVSEYYA